MENYKPQTFFDYFSIIVKWRWLLIRNFILSAILFLVISMIWPKTYKAESLIIPKTEKGTSFTSLIGDLSVNLVGESDINVVNYETIISSFKMRKMVIDKFHLFEVYDIEKYEVLLKKLDNNIIVESEITGGLGYQDIFALKLIVYDEDSTRAAAINNFILEKLQEIIIEIDVKKSRELKQFLEKRYNELIDELQTAEQKMVKFQNKSGLFMPDEQVKLIIENISNLNIEIVKLQVQRDVLKRNFKKENPSIKLLEQQIQSYMKKYDELILGNANDKNDGIVPLKNIPDDAVAYVRLMRDIEIKTKLLEFIIPQYEKAKIQEQKAISTLSIIDYARVPDWKDSPKRALIVIVGVFCVIMFSLLYIISSENLEYMRIYDHEKFQKIISIKKQLKSNLFGYK